MVDGTSIATIGLEGFSYIVERCNYALCMEVLSHLDIPGKHHAKCRSTREILTIMLAWCYVETQYTDRP
jgi:hypothetical protein